MPNGNEALNSRALMSAYQLVCIGSITTADPLIFSIQIDLIAALSWEKAIYAFVFGDKIMRFGSSKGPLGKRMKQWQRDVTNALRNANGLNAPKTATPEWEASRWIEIIKKYGQGEIYAREATLVTTPVGSFKAYMDEESILINRHKPEMNRHKNR